MFLQRQEKAQAVNPESTKNPVNSDISFLKIVVGFVCNSTGTPGYMYLEDFEK